MRPVETKTTDTTYAGVPSRDIGDLPTETGLELLPDGVAVQRHRSYWQLTEEERAAIMLGALVVVDVLGDAVPPLRPAVSEAAFDQPDEILSATDRMLSVAIGLSISSALAEAGITRRASDMVDWTDDDRTEVAIFLRAILGGTLAPAPAILALSDAETDTLAAAVR